MPRTKSILRYPGGKTQLTNFVKNTMKLSGLEKVTYCEPFSGGAGVCFSLLLNNDVENIILNDLDNAIYSIWFAVINEPSRLIDRIKNIPITLDTWYRQKEIYEQRMLEDEYSFDLAFATLFLNRTNRAGIINGGPIGGYKQESKYSIDCRFNKVDIINKISNISSLKERIRLYKYDAKVLIENILLNENPERLFVFFDPPYYKQGKHLYKNAFEHMDHVNLYNSIRLMDDYYWITTYDYCSEIYDIYHNLSGYSYNLQYSANKIRKEKEYIFHSSKTIIKSFDRVRLNRI